MSTLNTFVEKGRKIGAEQGEKIRYDKALQKNAANMLTAGLSVNNHMSAA
jgi:hypothetical protein